MSDLRVWQQPPIISTKEIIRQYERGFSGIRPDPEADERLASFGYASADEAMSDLGYADTGKGQLILPYRLVEKAYPNAYPGPAQRRGSCVAHNARNAALITLACEAAAGLPDPVTGYLEEPPEVSPEAEKAGVLAIEPAYNYRNWKDDGWYSSAAGIVLCKHTGAVARKDYGFVDLTRLDPDFAGKYWKADQIPREVKEAFDDNLFRDAAKCQSPEAIRDCLLRGIGVMSDGSEAFADTRDENGWARETGSWAHAMAVIGFDDRPEIHRMYGGPGLLIQNSWAKWNRGPRKILGTDIEIPEGCFWARWRDVKKRVYTAIAGLNGWRRKEIDSWLGGW